MEKCLLTESFAGSPIVEYLDSESHLDQVKEKQKKEIQRKYLLVIIFSLYYDEKKRN